MIHATINQTHFPLNKSTTILEACRHLGIAVPVFCYHPKLKIAGNCRMCLVEVVGYPKLVPSCHIIVEDGMTILTQSPTVKKAQQDILGLLLINHPLDCPVCDQGGECDLQDLTLHYGRGKSDYHFPKRSVKEKDLGPLVKTAMTRCIHCTRCTRFLDDLAGRPELVMIGRGENVEITNYLGRPLSSPLSGNIIDLCPVGALNNKPNAYRGRGWEYNQIPTIDVLDGVGSWITLHTAQNQVKRVLPRLCEDINQYWISDKIRFSLDGIGIQRLDQPYQRDENGRLIPVSWQKALDLTAHHLGTTNATDIAVLTGGMVDMETIYTFKKLLDRLGVIHRDCRSDLVHTPTAYPKLYRFNTPFNDIPKSDAILMVGSDLEEEAPVLYLQLYAHCKAHDIPIFVLSPGATPFTNLYSQGFLGNNPQVLTKILNGDHPCATILEQAKNPMIIVTPSALNRPDWEGIYKHCIDIAARYHLISSNWNGFNVVLGNASQVGALNLGFIPKEGGYGVRAIMDHWSELKLVYLVGVDEAWLQPIHDQFARGDGLSPAQKPFIIYQGHHYDRGATVADLILPGLTFVEKNASYMNIQGRLQTTTAALLPSGKLRQEEWYKGDWHIVKAISVLLEMSYGVDDVLDFNNQEELIRQLHRDYPYLQDQDKEWQWPIFSEQELVITNDPLAPYLENFYQSDSLSRHSPTMAKCRLAHHGLT